MTGFTRCLNVAKSGASGSVVGSNSGSVPSAEEQSVLSSVRGGDCALFSLAPRWIQAISVLNDVLDTSTREPAACGTAVVTRMGSTASQLVSRTWDGGSTFMSSAGTE